MITTRSVKTGLVKISIAIKSSNLCDCSNFFVRKSTAAAVQRVVGVSQRRQERLERLRNWRRWRRKFVVDVVVVVFVLGHFRNSRRSGGLEAETEGSTFYHWIQLRHLSFTILSLCFRHGAKFTKNGVARYGFLVLSFYFGAPCRVVVPTNWDKLGRLKDIFTILWKFLKTKIFANRVKHIFDKL